MATEIFSLTTSQALDKLVNKDKSVDSLRRTCSIPAKMAALSSPIEHYAGLSADMRMLFTSQSPGEQPFKHGYPVGKIVSKIGSHPIVGIFESQIRERISKLRTCQFDSVYVIRIGYNGNQDDPAVVLALVKFESMSLTQAALLGEKIMGICVDSLGCTIEVEIAEAMPSSGHTAVYQNPPLSNVPTIGTSIGGIDSDEIGTLGLYIECTRKDGAKEIYALTCAHVAVPNLPYDLTDVAEGYDVHEIGNVAHRVTIEAPARADAQLTLTVLKNQARLEKSILDSSSSPVAQQTLCTYTDYLKKYTTLGHVFKSSHYRQSPQRYILDWALVTPEPHITTLAVRDNLNMLPQLPHEGSDFYISRYKENYWDPPAQRLKKELANTVDFPSLVFKCGRTSKWTAGRVNEIDALRYGNWGEGRALCIIGAGVGDTFSKEGDSGSIVFTDEGRPVALIFGGRNSGLQDISTATPIDIIMEDIREKLDLEKVEVVC